MRVGAAIMVWAWAAGVGFALEWNPLDDPRGLVSRLPLVGRSSQPMSASPIAIYSASHRAPQPVRALVLPLVRDRAERETVERLAEAYAQSLAPLTESLRFHTDPAPPAVRNETDALFARLLELHHDRRRLDEGDALSRLTGLAYNLVLVVEVPAYRQFWGTRGKTTEVDLRVVGYGVEDGLPLLRAGQRVESAREHRGETWEVLERRALSALYGETRQRLEELQKAGPASPPAPLEPSAPGARPPNSEAPPPPPSRGIST